VTTDDEKLHEIEIEVVETDWGAARWKCSCGASSGVRWSRSSQEALKAAERHRSKHEQ